MVAKSAGFKKHLIRHYCSLISWKRGHGTYFNEHKIEDSLCFYNSRVKEQQMIFTSGKINEFSNPKNW